MSNGEAGDDYYFSESTVVPVLLKPKKMEDIELPLDFSIDAEMYKRTKVKRKTLRYVPKQD